MRRLSPLGATATEKCRPELTSSAPLVTLAAMRPISAPMFEQRCADHVVGIRAFVPEIEI
jgi:hypothetical protein